MTTLRRLRSNKKLTQKKVADYLGVARSTYAMYETGATEPDHMTLTRLADFFGVSIDYILGRTDNPAPPSDLSGTETDLLQAASEALYKGRDKKSLTAAEDTRILGAFRSYPNLSREAVRVAEAYDKAPQNQKRAVRAILELPDDEA